MRRALELAARGDFRVHPNPRVGAVAVRDGVVLGEGYHEACGGPHAEAALLGALPPGSARGATVYVTLEPCAAFPGKQTPACSAALIAAGVRRVVVADSDPNPGVAGAGVAALRAAGVEVEVGLCAREARLLNQPFAKWMLHGRPYVTAKWAMSLDGKIASRTGHARWISGPESRAEVHRLRGTVDAVLVGATTALVDDPLLTRRDAAGRDPVRVVVDTRGRLPLGAQLVETAGEHPLVWVVGHGVESAGHRALGVEVVELDPAPGGSLAPGDVLAALAARDLRHVLVEGGGTLLGAWLDAGAVDAVRVHLAPLLIGGADAPGPLGGLGVERVDVSPRLRELQVGRRGEDVELAGLLHEY
ncbi:MAG: bifunctional diaminohydroxyphosphoribosylaminopyrimidine deaminase/5-amino-6-(5-phosphoribosylamino)uracil reductase RibD [Planctomycetes bacterium]|nr:bifunctional diaminohydroxyphosphoribosylaminopyrimidine deaminase/5-amino-6-(5-phosphoribosylamino)uracil reductase RibD [Planctomycetota bacterium]